MGRPRRHPLVDRICEQCKSPYTAPDYRNKKFCSQKCYRESAALITYTCEVCGKRFQRIKRNDRPLRRFCSRRCVIRGANPVKTRWENARRNGWTPKLKPTAGKCLVEGCEFPPLKIRHKGYKCWYGRLCAEHRKQHRFALYDQYDSVKKYGAEFAPVHMALKQLRRTMKAAK